MANNVYFFVAQEAVPRVTTYPGKKKILKHTLSFVFTKQGIKIQLFQLEQPLAINDSTQIYSRLKSEKLQ